MYLYFLIIMFGFCRGGNFSIEDAGDTLDLTSCLNVLLEDLTEKDFIYSIGFDLNLKNPIIRLDLTENKVLWFNQVRSNVIVINLRENSLDSVLQNISENLFFNSRSNIIVITNKIKKSLFKAAARNYVDKLLVMELQSQKVYTYRPYRYGSVNNPVTTFSIWATCSNGDLVKRVNTVRQNLPQRWPKTTIKALNNIIPPYAICPSCPTDRGIEIEVFDIISEHLQLKVAYTRNDFIYWGTKNNGSYSHILGELQRREGDMGIGVFHSKFDEHLDFDMSVSYMEDSTRWLVPKAKILPYWKRLGLIFAKEVYVSLLFSIIVMVAVCKILYKISYSTSWMMLFQVLLEVSLKQLPIDFRTVIIIWIASCLILSTMFKSKLIDIMSKDSYEHQINTLGDIVNSKLEIVIDHDIATFYRNSTNPDEDYIRRNYKYCINPRICINRTAFLQDCVTVDFQRSNSFFLPHFVEPDGDILIHLFGTPIFLVHIHLFFVKGYPIFPQIDELLLRLRSNGVVKHLYDNASHNARLAMRRKTTFKAEVLGLDQLQVAFIIWSLGIFISSFVFVVEYLMAMGNLQNQKRHNRSFLLHLD